MGSLRHSRQMVTFLSGIAVVFLAGSYRPSFAAWKQVAFHGKEVTAITNGIDLFNSQPIVVVGTKDTGVYSISLIGDTIRRYPRYINASDKPAGRILTLFASADGVMAFAGTDSGLYAETMISQMAPVWRKMNTVPSEPVVGIACKDSTYCLATATELYRSKSPWAYSNAWTPCSVSKWLPSPSRTPNFTSLTSWGLNGFVAGSNAASRSNAFGGVIANTGADRWDNATCFNGQCVDSNVYSLTTGDGKLFAGTSRGIFWAVEFDTGTWYPMTPQLASPPARHMCVTLDSVSHAREIYTSTDSGVYVLSPRVNANQWTLSLKVKAYGVASPSPENAAAVYAATADGVWKYEPATGISPLSAGEIRPNRNSVSGIYSINGRKMAPTADAGRLAGVYIVPRQTGKCKKVLLGTGNRP